MIKEIIIFTMFHPLLKSVESALLKKIRHLVPEKHVSQHQKKINLSEKKQKTLTFLVIHVGYSLSKTQNDIIRRLFIIRKLLIDTLMGEEHTFGG